MKKIVLVAIMALMGQIAWAQATGCNDTISWNQLTFVGNECCWTIPAGSNWEQNCCYSQITSDYDATADHRILSPWIRIPATAANDSLMLIYTANTFCESEYSLCITTDGVNFDTLYRGLVLGDNGYGYYDSIYMGTYAGQVVRLEFCHYGLTSAYNVVSLGCQDEDPTYAMYMFIDDIKLLPVALPNLWPMSTTKAYVGDTTLIQIGINNGSTNGLTYTWHSSLMDYTFVDSTLHSTNSTFHLVYTVGGIDTVTVVATNAYGSDTAMQVITVVDCSGVITAHPWIVNFATDFDCWRMVSGNGWRGNYTVNGVEGIYGSPNSSNADLTIASPAVVLPADTTGLRLYWKDRRMNSNPTYYVMVSTTDRFDLAAYDTIATYTLASGSALTQRSVSLAPYAGDTVYIAFRLKNQAGRRVFIADVRMYNALTPLGTLEAPSAAATTGDTLSFIVHLTQADDSPLAYSWHSTLLDTTIVTADSTFDIVYPEAGNETMTVTVSNAYGALVLSKSFKVFACDTVSEFPWNEEFVEMGSNASYNACWEISGWEHLNEYSTYGFTDEDGNHLSFNDLMYSTNASSYMVTPPIRVPATGAERLKLWLRHVGGLMATVSTDGGATFPDTIYQATNSNLLLLRAASLAPYAGQTVRVRITGSQLIRVGVDYDTVPRVNVTVPAKVYTDSAFLCTAALRYGATEGLHFTWTSALGGTITTNALGDSAWVTYGAGVGTTNDVLTVVASNAFGSDSVTKSVHIIDCSPALTLPWKETFADGTVCWYIPEGSNWHDAIPYGDSYFEYLRHLFSHCTSDTIDSWIMSKAIVLPADTNETVYLFWKVASSNTTFVHTYRVMVTTSDNFTDTSVYELLYFDSSTHVNFSGYYTRSVSLAQYAGQTIHLAFNNRPVNYVGSSVGLYIDDVEVRSAKLPVVSLSAPTVVNSHEPIAFTATLVEGSYNGLTITWHSSLMNTSFTESGVQSSEFGVFYTVGGTDIITVIASNVYGADTATAVLTVNGCLINSLSWTENFSGLSVVAYNAANGKIPSCWKRYWNGSNANYTPHVIGSYLNQTSIHTYCQSNPALLLMAGTSVGWDSVAIVESPFVEGGINGKVLSFTYMQENASCGILSVGYMQDGAFVSVVDMPPQSLAITQSVLLANVPDTIQRFALQWKKTGTWYGVIVDNLQLSLADTLPEIFCIYAPESTFVGDVTTFRVSLSNGYTDSLTYSWYSTLLDTTILTNNPTLQLVYPAEGIDIVTLVVSNAYGVDTMYRVINVISHPLPQVTLAGPTSLTMLGNATSRTATFTTTINDCSLNGLTYLWHSTLTGLSATDSNHWTVEYTTGGIDTVTVIVLNDYGADTAMMLVHVFDCSGENVPYYENFNGIAPVAWNTTVGNLPLCWSVVVNASNVIRPKVVSSYQYIYSNPLVDNALIMVAGSSSGYVNTAYTLLPFFADSLQHLSLALDYRFETTDRGVFVVGYYDNDLQTFTAVDTLVQYAGGFRRDTVGFQGIAPTENSRMALQWTCTTSFYAVIIDNIEVFVDNAIPAPADLTVNNVTAHCATLSWQPVDSATAYAVSLTGVSDTVVSGTTVTFCGLEEETDYSVRVAAIVDGEQGHYTPFTTFTTQVYCAQLASVTVSPEGIINWQYGVDGELTHTGVSIEITDLLNGALVVSDVASSDPYVPANLTPGHTYAFVVRTLCGSVTANGGDTIIEQITPSTCAEETSNTTPTNSHFMDNFWESNYSQVVYPVSFAATVDTLYGIALRAAAYEPYSWATTSGDCRYDIYVGQTTATLTSPLTSDSLTMVVQDKRFLLSGFGWQNFIFDTPYVYDGTGSLIITIVSRQSSDVFEPVYGVHTDASCIHFVQDADHGSDIINPATLNFQWEINTNIPDIRLLGGCGGSVNTCLAPDVEVTAVDTHSVSFGWQQRGSEDQWQVEYRVVGSSTWMVAGTTTTTSYTLTGLQQATHYELRVGSLCSDGIAYSFPDTATTLCGYMELPYTISFLNEEVPCWTIGNHVTHYTWLGFTLYHWDTEDHYIISPEVIENIADMRAIITSKCAITSATPRFAVGVCNADGSGAVWIDTIGFVQQNVQQTDEVYFNHYAGNGHYIILQSVEGSSDIMQFTLEAFSGCVPVHEVEVDQVEMTTAFLQWTPEDASHTFAIYLNGTLYATTGATSYNLTGLTPNTQYTASVREICAAGDTSIAISCHFHTRCMPVSLPFFDDFAYAGLYDDTDEIPDCWVVHGAHPRILFSNFDGYLTVMHLYNSYGSNDGASYICSPRLMVGSGGATVRFKGQAAYTSSFQAGIMVDQLDTNTFIPVTTVTVNSGGLAWYEFSTDTIAGMSPAGNYSIAFRWEGTNQGSVDSLIVTSNTVTTYELVLNVNDPSMGTVTGSGTYDEGSLVTVTATPNAGYQFVQWSDSVTAATRSVKMESDVTLTAYFAPVEGISEVNGNSWVLYPNPATTSVTIESTEPAAVSILDVSGRKVMESKVASGSTKLDISHLSQGVYFVRVDGNIAVRKLIVRR